MQGCTVKQSQTREGHNEGGRGEMTKRQRKRRDDEEEEEGGTIRGIRREKQ